VAGGEPDRCVAGERPNKGQFVWRRGAKACPDAQQTERGQRWQIERGTGKHRRKHFLVDGRAFITILTRRTDENLPGLARLHIESH
jgi:hypothetical protein